MIGCEGIRENIISTAQPQNPKHSTAVNGAACSAMPVPEEWIQLQSTELRDCEE